MFGLLKTKDVTKLPPLQLFNSETRELEVFEPLHKRSVKMYSCGPTVYDLAHIGNLRAYVFADTLKRVLLLNGYDVNHTVNYTDFGHLTSDGDTGDDKMMKGLKREGMTVSLENMRTLSDRYITAFEDDIASLNIIFPTQFSRASDYVTEQIKLIETLDEKGYLYETSDGLYFEVAKFPTYGRLGNIDIEALKDGARVEVNNEKKHPADFAVWKKGDLGWHSKKYGTGFPGWHIECSAMAFSTLGKQIDIHTGGVDNMPTHHNGEIAQCEAASGKQFVKYWLHSEHLNIDNAKISKSDGSSQYLADIQAKGVSGETYRYWLLTSHYRSQVNLTDEALQGAKQALHRLKRYVYEDWADEKGALHTTYWSRFVAAVNDDLDTPKAIATLWEMIKDDTVSNGEKRTTLREADLVLGIGLALDTEEGLRELGHVDVTNIPQNVQELVDAREAARIAQNWPEADRLRDAIGLAGYTIEDSQDGPKLTKQ